MVHVPPKLSHRKGAWAKWKRRKTSYKYQKTELEKQISVKLTLMVFWSQCELYKC
jgi:hypothetical protein